jgi:glutamate-1-semialdehyde 2,1-aminomutase
MTAPGARHSRGEEAYERHHPEASRLHERARRVVPAGITHDGRYLRPFPDYFVRGEGSHKWDADGHEYIDYAMGHGALLLGHGHPKVMEAVARQLGQGTHLGGSHPLEIEWAERIQSLVACADRVRFTASGTEATALAARLARAATGRDRIIKFEGHFHGWNDYLIAGEKPPFDAPALGVPRAVRETVSVLPHDLDRVREELAAGDVAAIFVEPSGASWATVPLPGGHEFLRSLSALAGAAGCALVFDEVITGFRWAPGGAQETSGVVPDLCALAKVMAGGLPGGAVAGRAQWMAALEMETPDGAPQPNRVWHSGTFNANPLSAAAGIATLELVADGSVQDQADELAQSLRTQLSQLFRSTGVNARCYGEASVYHVVAGFPELLTVPDSGDHAPALPLELLKAGMPPVLARRGELAMLERGIHIFHQGGLLSSAHTAQDVDRTLEAWSGALEGLKSDGDL